MKSLPSVKRFAPVLLALALLSAVSPVCAEETAPKKEKGPSKSELKKYDANGDGQLDEAETAKMKADEKARREVRREEELAKYDANKDGKLNKDEKEKMKSERAAARAERKAEKEAAKEARDGERK